MIPSLSTGTGEIFQEDTTNRECVQEVLVAATTGPGTSLHVMKEKWS